MLVSVILAGGKGTRLWPLSRPDRPKPFVSILGDQTLLQYAVDSVKPLTGIASLFVVVDAEYADLVRRDLPLLPDSNLILEPAGKNTAAAVGLAALSIASRFGPETIMLVLAVDHVITSKPSHFIDALATGARVAQSQDLLVDIGVWPTRPDTKYGYLHISDLIEVEGQRPTGPQVFRVLKYIEKPDPEIAASYLQGRQHLWNTAIFVWRCSVILKAIDRHFPELREMLGKIRPYIGTDSEKQKVEDAYCSFNTPISVDYSILERADNIAAVAGDFGWTEIGSWASLETVLPADQHDNIVMGDHTAIDTNGCILFSSKSHRIVTLGLSDIIVAEADGTILVCPKSAIGQLQQTIKQLEV